MRLRRGDSAKLYGTGAGRDERQELFTDGRTPVAVYGLGKMGLPLSVVFAGVTGNVVGVDVDATVVGRVNEGDCPVSGEPRLPELLAAAVNAEALQATTEAAWAADAAAVHVVIVPTTIRSDTTPDLSNLRTAARDIGGGLDRGDVVLVESTVPPGTCRDVVAPLLEAESGLSVGEFGVAFCPERTSSGRALRDIRSAYPKVVGGVDAESGDVAELIYDEVTTREVIRVRDAATAESVKVFEGVYRDVNIALANELAKFADELGVDVRDAIAAANTQPFCDIHDPGIGVGGHCIPYYPYFLINEFATEAPMLRTARRVNDGMPFFALSKLLELLEEADVAVADARVLVAGLTYRPGVDETRESPAKPIVEHLDRLGATVLLVDPVLSDFSAFPGIEVEVGDVESLDLDAAVLATAHEEFAAIDWSRPRELVVLDGRDALDLEGTDHAVYTIGRGRTGRERGESP